MEEKDIYTTLEEVLEEEKKNPPIKKVSKKTKQSGCKDCPDYKDNTIDEKIKNLKSKGYNNNQIASMLGIHKQYVDSNE